MRVLFMGTPEFARRALEYLYKNTRHDIIGVVTGMDKPSGRGLKLVPTAVRVAADQLDLPVLTPDSLKDPAFLKAAGSLGSDIAVVVAFRILPEVLYTLPPRGSINLHGSLLPKYRGAAPINWALINGEKETGLTTFFLQKKVDTGEIIYQEKVAIGHEETFDELYFRMSELAGPVIEKSLDLIESGDFVPRKQDDIAATPAPKLSPEDATIDWGFPADNVINFIRGLSSVPGSFTGFRGKKLKMLRARKSETETGENYEPGQVIKHKEKLIIATAGGAIEILELIPEGKSRMTGAEFVRGYRPDDREIMSARSKGIQS